MLLKAWLERGWLACLLLPLALVHALLIRARRYLYRIGVFASDQYEVVVIVAGNVVAGGAGKTPVVMELVKHLQSRGLRVGVVSRGYGRSSQQPLEVKAQTPIEDSGDEPALIHRATGAPVFVATARADAVRSLLAAYPATEVIVSDDGLQHYALQRDIEIAVFDDRGVGNGWLLPAGPLREPWPERLRQGVSLVLHTGQKPAFEGFNSSRQLADQAIARDGRRVELNALKGQPLVALAGIANPEAFFDMLRFRGLSLAKVIALPDHHQFTSADISALAGHRVLCTEKDAVKLFALASDSSLDILAVPLEFSPEPAFYSALDALLAPLLSQLPSGHGHQTT